MSKLGLLLVVVSTLAASCGRSDDKGLNPTEVQANGNQMHAKVRYFVADTKDLKSANLPLVAISDDGVTAEPLVAVVVNFSCEEFPWSLEVPHYSAKTALVLSGESLNACLTDQKIHWAPKKPGRLFSESSFTFRGQTAKQNMTYTQVNQEQFLDLVYSNIPTEGGKHKYSPLTGMGDGLCERFFDNCAEIDHDRL